MNILIAPNSMKGSLNAFDFADTVEEAFLECSREFSVRKVPVADGGDFTGEVLRRALRAEEIRVNVCDPLGRKVPSKYAVSGKTAIVEMADASGIKLLKTGELNPLKTSSFGTGQLIKHAIESGCDEILLGIGGSATVDGGLGMLEALGFQFFDSNGEFLKGNGENMERVQRIKKPRLPEKFSVKVISDVDNPLLGKNGAAAVFGPQKGATPPMVEKLEEGLKNWVGLLENLHKEQLAILKGAGAAGGIALPLVAFFNAQIVPGADFILSKLGFEKHVRWANLVITGEGKIDSQTLNNKAPGAVAKAAHRQKKPVIAIGGAINREASVAFDGIFSFINRPLKLEKSMKDARKLLFGFSCELAKMVLVLNKQN